MSVEEGGGGGLDGQVTPSDGSLKVPRSNKQANRWSGLWGGSTKVWQIILSKTPENLSLLENIHIFESFSEVYSPLMEILYNSSPEKLSLLESIHILSNFLKFFRRILSNNENSLQ